MFLSKPEPKEFIKYFLSYIYRKDMAHKIQLRNGNLLKLNHRLPRVKFCVRDKNFE